MSNLSLYSQLKQCWINERNCPELLPYDHEVIDETMQSLRTQQERVDQIQNLMLSKKDVNNKLEEYQLQYPLLQLEIDRIKYLVSSYLRTRLKKIDRYVMHFLSSKVMNERLSPAEINYAVKFVDILDSGFTKPFLSRIPESLSTLVEESMIDKPDLDTFVIIRVLEDIGEYRLSENDDEETVNLQKGEIYALRYDSIRPLLLEKQVELI